MAEEDGFAPSCGGRTGDRQAVLNDQPVEFFRLTAFVKIRHYGIMANRSRQTKLVRCKKLPGSRPTPSAAQAKTDWQQRMLQVTGVDLSICPSCAQGRMHTVQVSIQRDNARQFDISTVKRLTADPLTKGESHGDSSAAVLLGADRTDRGLP